MEDTKSSNTNNKKGSKNLLVKTLKRWRSFGTESHGKNLQSDLNPSSPRKHGFGLRSKSTSCIVPAGCFTVCVGPEKERFVVRTECLNHKLFQSLLAQAENEFGFRSDGPLELPCDVEIFDEIILEMEQENSPRNSPKCSFSPYQYGLVTPSRLVTEGRI